MMKCRPYPLLSFPLPVAFKCNHNPSSPCKTLLSNTNHSPAALFSASSQLSITTPQAVKGEKEAQVSLLQPLCPCCARRRFIHGAGATPLLSFSASHASECADDPSPMAILNKIHPPRPDWYEELYASVLSNDMKTYEAEVASYKSQLFTGLRGKVEKVLEIGIGTGTNFKYYASDSGLVVIGIDPNKKMEKYAQASAVSAGLPVENFKFVQAVGEALPVKDASIDAVIGTLVLCSVQDVAMTLREVKRVLKPGGVFLFVEHVAAKDGTPLRVLQNFLNPLQQIVADGCHLTRNTGKHISEAGFLGLYIGMAFLSGSLFLNPLLYGMARK